MLDIKDMSDEDCLYHFMKGLQNWVQAYLHRQGVKTLVEYIAAIDKLLYFQVDGKEKDKGNEDDNEKGQGKFKKKLKNNPKNGGNHEEETTKSTDTPKYKARIISCYICTKDHYAKNCPLRP